MTAEQRRACIEEIRSLPAQLQEAVSGLDEEQLGRSYREGGWNVRQIVHHIADSHANAYVRMRLIATEDHPTLKPYDQDEWAALADYAMPPDVSLDLIRGLHTRWAVFLESLPEESWGRTAYHPENGEVSMESLLRTYADHGNQHLDQIGRAVSIEL